MLRLALCIAALLSLLCLPPAHAQLLDLSQMRGLSKVPPIESTALILEGDVTEKTFDLIKSTLVHFDVDDTGTLYEISLTPEDPIGLTLQALKLDLNDANQVTKKTTLLSDSSFGPRDEVAILPATLLAPGRIYIAMAAVNSVNVTLRIKRTSKVGAPIQASKSSRTPTASADDVLGISDGVFNCIVPAAFSKPGADDALLVTDPQSYLEIGAYTANAKRLGSHSGYGQLNIRGLKHQGANSLCISAKKGKSVPETAWRLIMTPSESVAAEPDAETPLDTLTMLKPNETLRAPIDMKDYDRYRIDGEGVFNLAYRSNASSRVCVYQGRQGGRNIEECYGTYKVNIGPFRKGPETLISVTQRGKKVGLYELTLTPSTASEETTLFEPNYYSSFQESYKSTSRISGRLSGSGDVDTLTIDAGDEAQMWRFVVLGDTVSQVVFKSVTASLADIRRSGRTGRRLVTPDMYLQPGPVRIAIYGKAGDYKVIAKPLGSPPAWSELEPNHSLPRRIAFAEEIRGTLDTSDTDKFSFFLHRDADVTFKMNAPAGATYSGSLSAPGLYREKITGAWEKTASLPAGEHVLTLSPSVTSPAEYDLLIDYADPFKVNAPKATIDLASALPAIQAFSLFEQTLEIPLSIQDVTSALDGRLLVWADRPGVTAQPVPVSVAAGSSNWVSVSVTFPPDLYDGPLRIAFGVVNPSGKPLASRFLDLDVDAQALASNAREALPAPPSLIGGINVANSALGAKWVSVDGIEIDKEGDYARGNPYSADGLFRLIDGIIEQGQPPTSHEGYLTIGSEKPLAPVLDLPGDAAIPIAGIGIDTRMYKPIGIRKFAVDVSLDGTTWDELLSAVHDTWGKPAYYEAENGAKPAKFVRLRALDKRGAPNSSVALNAFEVIAKPGGSGLSRVNIANKELGALTSSQTNMRASRWKFLDAAVTNHRNFYSSENPTDSNAAITFKNTLEADIAALELVYGSGTKNAQFALPTEAIVYASPKGPTGPWREIARTAYPETPTEGQVIRIDLPEFITARAVKVEYAHSGKGSLRAPAQIRIFERPEDDEYRSVLGLWGQWRAQRAAKAPAALVPESGDMPTLAPDGNANAQTVEFSKDEDTWRIPVAGGANTVRVSVTGSPGFDPSIRAKNASGTALEPIETVRSEFLKDVTYIFPAQPGSHIDVTVSEDQRSTIFLIDQSASVASYIPRIRRAIVDFASDMVEGRDAVQFKALGRSWAKEGWYTDPIPLRTDLANYQGGGNSSAETAMLEAAKKLAEQDGSRALVIITDADVDAQSTLMSELEKARVRVFVIKISSGGMWQNPVLSQPLSMLWAGVTGGEVSSILQSEDISVAYARASARLLGPKPYTISAELETRVIDPGLLEVAALSADNRTKSLDNLLIIFDASGSMLKRLEGTRRIKLAKGAVQGLFFEDRLDSSQTNIGLRVFGGPPGSCETNLVEPLGTNNIVTLARAVNVINPQNNAKTAIGASLLAAKNDMAGKSGASSILLITDGEETCGGDPLNAIAALRDAGIDTRIDVVSFALEPEIDRRTFEGWAKAGGGIYADAQSSADLQAAIATAVQARFEVIKDGAVIASGLTGGPTIELAPGQYRLRQVGGKTAKTITISEAQTTATMLPPS